MLAAWHDTLGNPYKAQCSRLRNSACRRIGYTIHLVRWFSQRVEEEQDLQAALPIARNLLDDRRSLIRVDQERRWRSAECCDDGFQVCQTDWPEAGYVFTINLFVEATKGVLG
jgi:hypothetical protein